MTAVLLLSRAALALTFVVSALSKAADPLGTREAAGDLGVPARFARGTAAALPVVELVAAVLLVLGAPAVQIGAALSLALLAIFSIAIARVLRAGTSASCRCFGGLSSKPLSARSLVRNGLLAALAAVSALPADRSVLRAAADGSRALWFAVAAAVLLGGMILVLLVLLRRYGAALRRIEALETGGSGVLDLAPPFALPDLDGNMVTTEQLRADGVPVLLLFMSPTCGPCRGLAPRVGAWHRRYGDALRLVVVSDGRVEANRLEFPDPTLTVVLETDASVSSIYAPGGTPAAVVLLPDGRRLSEPAYAADDIGELVQTLTLDRLAGEAELHTPMLLGAPLPRVTAEDLIGNDVSVATAAPGRSVLLFWSTTCSYAARIADDVLSWEQAKGDAPPTLVVLSGGPVTDVRSLGFRGPVLLDPHLDVGNALGVVGTPSAFVVQDGRLASEVVAGGPAILELLAAERDRAAQPVT